MGKARPRVSFALRDPALLQAGQHVRQINALRFSPGGEYVMSAGRDGLVRQWTPTNLEITRVYDHHSHWVNDIAFISETKVASCSSDLSIRVWNTSLPDSGVQVDHEAVAVLNGHTDYIQKVCFEQNHLASAGLDKCVSLWDVEKAVPIIEMQDPLHAFVASCRINELRERGLDSIYSLAMSSNSHVLVSGSSDKVVRVWDWRQSGRRVIRLSGHSDNIRAAVMNADGTRIITGGSDRTLRIWDVGQQACIHTIRCHKDSVWDIAVNKSFTRVISGSRDKTAHCTSLRTLETRCVCCVEAPVSAVAVDSSDKSPRVLIGTETGDLITFSLKATLTELDAQDEMFSSPQTARRATRSFSELSPKLLPSSDEPFVPIEMGPLHEIPGRAPVKRYHVLNNRRQILTECTDGMCQLWDVCRCSLLETYEGIDFEQKKEELSTQFYAPQWFSSDSKLGVVMVHLDGSSAYSMVMYANDLDLSESEHEHANQDSRIIIGLAVLNGLFRGVPKEYEREGAGEPEICPVMTAFDVNPSIVFSVSLDTDGPHIHRTIPSKTDASTKPFLPDWVFDCVVLCQRPIAEDKVSFRLEACDPVPGQEDLPECGNKPLTASPIVRVEKVQVYVRKLLTDIEEKYAELDYDVLCKGTLLPKNYSLQTIQHFIWKSGKELILHYRIAEPQPTTVQVSES